MSNLNKEELELLESVENGEWKSVKNVELEILRYQQIAEQQFETSINIPFEAIVREININELTLNVYMLPDGEKRIGVQEIGVLLGKSKQANKLQIQNKDSNLFDSLIIKKVISKNNCSDRESVVDTISTHDFIKLITYEAIEKRNRRSINLLLIFSEIGLEPTLSNIFADRSIDTFFQRVKDYEKNPDFLPT